MGVTIETQADRAILQRQARHWGWASRVAFRFCLLYFGLYCLLTQIFGGLVPVPGLDIPDLGTLPGLRDIVIWTAKHVFRYSQALVYSGSGSGDKAFDWVQIFCLLVVALAGTCLWSVLDRRRTDYTVLDRWFRVFLRFAVAGQLFVYGIFKVIPMQMPFPFLKTLLERTGDLSPMGVLWFSVGASPAYERFVGSAELIAGLLLVLPVTTMLGALICLADMIEVFVLNMTYDVPVKLFSFQMILMAIYLLIPERRRLTQFCFRDCAVERSTRHRLFIGERANRIAIAAQLVFGLVLLGSAIQGARQQWFQYGGGAPKSPFYGIWNVDEMSIDGVVRSPLLTDYDRWRRVVFDFPQSMSFQRMDDSFEGFAIAYDPKTSKVELTKRGDKNWKGELSVQRQGTSRMVLDGQLGQHKTRMQLSLFDRNKFLLVSRGFHWVQDYPFNR
jgi:uncharacterized membrane protein YphA (DoxX/SURF4 family)